MVLALFGKGINMAEVKTKESASHNSTEALKERRERQRRAQRCTHTLGSRALRLLEFSSGLFYNQYSYALPVLIRQKRPVTTGLFI